MRFQVTILGSSSALPMAGKHHSAHALNVHEQFYLVDCGEGTQSRLMKYGINPMKINAVFISHLHGDHLYGLFPLIDTLVLMGRRTPLKIFAPAPMKEIMADHFKYFVHEDRFEIEYHEVDTRQNRMVYENSVMEVWTIPLRHKIPSAGYLFREKTPGLNVRKDKIEEYGLGVAQIVAAKRGEDLLSDDGRLIPNGELTYVPYSPRSFAYCSDTLPSGKVAGIVDGVDLLYHEATFSRGDAALARQTGHSTAAQAAGIARDAAVGELLIGHFSGRYKEPDLLLNEAREVFPATRAAEEGGTIDIKIKSHG